MNLNLMRKTGYVISIFILILLIQSCNKESEKSHLSVQMTDSPGNYTAVFVDIQGVEITGNGGSLVMLNTVTGIYNLLDFTNGINTLIASGDLDAGEVSQIRLILGTDNTVIVDGVEFPLSTPSAMQSGLKCQIHQTFEPGVSYNILLDFDANKSIVVNGSGEYQLKPVIRTIDTAISGSIRGSITPINAIAVISTSLNGMMCTTVNNTNGEFLIAGLTAGIYDITITPAAPLQTIVKTGVIVTVGVSTDIGVIEL